jgi:2-polyprenyl-3-methyl-5-hydroxy-6-metoxy-1,4-benzoquinol methylase
MQQHTTCITCGSASLIPLHSYYESKGLIQCTSCGLVFMERIPTAAELETHYGVYTYDTEDTLSSLTIDSYNTLLDEMEPYRNVNRILDVGCGRGYFLEEARKRGWEVYGTEFSQTAVDLLQRKGIHAYHGPIGTKAFEGLSFDVVTSFEVIEHINTPNEDLMAIHQKLRSGGLLYITTPNFNSLMRYVLKSDYNVIAFPEHLSYYTRKTLNKTVCRQGFKNIKFLSTGISITRIQHSLAGGGQGTDSDEKLRKLTSSNALMGFVKRVVNKTLTALNMGIALKGYYVKEA